MANLLFCLIIALFLAGCGQAAGPDALETDDPSVGQLPTGPKAAELDSAHPVVKIRTSLGEFTVELDAENTPITVDNFLEYVGRKFYDGLIFHQVESGYTALAGGYDAQLQSSKPGFPIRNEAHKAAKNTRGTLAMARDAADIDSATSQFYINLADNPNLDHTDRTPEAYGYCVFGKVTEGQTVLDKLSSVQVSEQKGFTKLPDPPVVIESIRRIR